MSERTPDIAAGRLAREEYVANFSDLHPPARRPPGRGRGRPLLLLLRRALRARLPDGHRHPDIHPRDSHRPAEERRRNDPVGQHPRRHVRPRVPDGDALRGGLRARGGRGQARTHRPAPALRHRHPHGGGPSALRPRALDREARRRHRRRSGRPLLRPSAGHARPRRGHLRREAETRRPSTNTASPPTRRPATSPRPRWISSSPSAASRSSLENPSARISPLDELRTSYDAVFIGLGLAGVNAVAHEPLKGTHHAVHYIADLRQAEDLATLPVGPAASSSSAAA